MAAGASAACKRGTRCGVTRAEVQTLLELVRLGRLRPVLGGSLPLADAARAHRMMESREACGRLVLTM